MKNFKTNTEVEWDWGNGTASGYIREKFINTVTRTIDGNEVTRKASEETPAYMIEQNNGQRVLKSSTEIRKA